MTNTTAYYQNPSNISAPQDFFLSYVNTQTGGALGPVIVGLTFGVTFMALQNYNPRKAFAAASFNGLIVTMMLSVLGIAGSFMYTLMTALVALAVIINRGNQGGAGL